MLAWHVSWRVEWLLVGLLTTACDPSHGLVVDLRSDLVPGAEFEEVEVRLYEGAERGEPTRLLEGVRVDFGADATGGIRIAELDELAPGPHLVSVRLLRGSTSVVAEGEVIVDVEGFKAVTVLVTRDCVGVTCEEGATVSLACRNGVCDDARCGPEHPELCTETGCVTDADCVTGAPACVRETCVEGACFSRPDDGACAGRCDASRGCVEAGAPFIPPVPGGPATYYVSPNGDDGNDGSMIAPWASINFAMTQVAPGDVVEVLDGVYEEIVEMRVPGSAVAPIVLRSSTGGAIIDGTNVTDATDPFSVVFFATSFITMHGFEVRGSNRHCLRALDSDAITLSGLVVHSCGSCAISGSFADDLHVRGNRLRDLVSGGVCMGPAGDRFVIDGNHIHDAGDSGVYCDSGQPDIDMGGDGFAADATITRNLIERTGNGGGAALNVASLRGATIVNNVLLDNLASGIALFEVNGTASTDCFVAHNTIVFASGAGRSAMVLSGAVSNHTIINNVLLAGASPPYDVSEESLAGHTFDANVVHSRDSRFVVRGVMAGSEERAAWQGRGYDARSVFALPEFIDAANGSYALVDAASGRDAARVEARVTVDYAGAPRGDAPDIGAFEAR